MMADRRLPPGALVFVSDIHLEPSAGRRTAAFTEFLARLERSQRPEGLLILGDLFDTWLGRASLEDPAHAPVLAALRGLSDAGVAVAAFQGNRDFLLDGAFAARTGARVVEEGLAIELGGRRAFLCHGDRLPLADRAHRRMRWVLRSAPARAAAALLPESTLLSVAHWLRRKSERRGARRRAGQLCIPPREVARILRGGFDLVIAGHIHQEGRRGMVIDGRPCEFYTLGAWEERGSALVWDGAALTFLEIPF